jgi:hypothetical protein
MDTQGGKSLRPILIDFAQQQDTSRQLSSADEFTLQSVDLNKPFSNLLGKKQIGEPQKQLFHPQQIREDDSLDTIDFSSIQTFK